jgi:hypothetical protein
VIEAFAFSDSGRTFTCSIQERSTPRPEAWWWFRVSTDRQHRYAPFRATAADTSDSVRSRIVAYYDNLLAQRALPPVSHWGRRRGATTAAPATAAPATATP